MALIEILSDVAQDDIVSLLGSGSITSNMIDGAGINGGTF